MSELRERLTEEQTLRARIRDLQSDLDNLGSELAAARHTVDELEDTVEELEGEFNDLHARRDDDGWQESYRELAELVLDVDRGLATFAELLQTVRR